MADTRERILEATRELWNERGFATVRVAEIAKAVGISTGNLTYHFPAKRDLVKALYERAEKALLGLVREWPPETALAELPGWIRRLSHEIWRDRFLFRDTPQLAAEAPELIPRARATVVAEGRVQFQAGIEALARAGDLEIAPAELPRLVTNAWILVRYWVEYLVEARGVRDIRPRHAEELVSQYLSLLRPYLTADARRRLAAQSRPRR